MIKHKLKIGVSLLALSLMMVLGIHQVSAVSGLTFTENTVVTINGNDYVIRTGSEATSLVVNSTSIVVTVPDTKTFTLTSGDGFTLTNDQSVSESCSSNSGTITYTSTGSTVLTVTPTTDVVCGGGSGGGGGGGGHSSGGSSSSSSTPTTPTVPSNNPVSCAPGQMFSASTGQLCTTTTVVYCSPGQMFDGATGQACNTTVYPQSTGGGSSSGSGYAFGTTLVKVGTKGEACRAWQMFFNDHAGAHLSTDGICGKLTMAVARSWQASVGLSADGMLGAMSRAKARQ